MQFHSVSIRSLKGLKVCDFFFKAKISLEVARYAHIEVSTIILSIIERFHFRGVSLDPFQPWDSSVHESWSYLEARHRKAPLCDVSMSERLPIFRNITNPFISRTYQQKELPLL